MKPGSVTHCRRESTDKMPDRPKVLVAHQWKSDRGLYGADKMLLRVLREMLAMSEPIVVIESEGELADAVRAMSCRVIVREMGVLRRAYMTPAGLLNRLWHTLRSASWLARYIRQNDIRLVFTSTVSVTASALAARVAGRPHLWFIQEILSGKAALLSFLVRALSTRIIANSEACARSIHRGHKLTAGKICVAYPGVDARQFDNAEGESIRRKYGAGKGEVLIGLVGRLHYWKGQDYFLDALSELRKRNVNGFLALLVGAAYRDHADYRRHLEDKARQLGLGEQVIFCGHINDTPSVFKALDIVVAPSTQAEPFGLVVAEAMAARRPVIATAWGGPKEMIRDEESGFLIPPDDPVEFSRRLEQLIRSPQLREQLGHAAGERIEASFSASAFDAKLRATVAEFITG
jgi:glycosyltransferase involved in cell wall biosynthesis